MIFQKVTVTQSFDVKLSNSMERGRNNEESIRWYSWEILVNGKPVGEIMVEETDVFDGMVDVYRMTCFFGQEIMDYRTQVDEEFSEQQIEAFFIRITKNKMFQHGIMRELEGIIEEYKDLRK